MRTTISYLETETAERNNEGDASWIIIVGSVGFGFFICGMAGIFVCRYRTERNKKKQRLQSNGSRKSISMRRMSLEIAMPHMGKKTKSISAGSMKKGNTILYHAHNDLSDDDDDDM